MCRKGGAYREPGGVTRSESLEVGRLKVVIVEVFLATVRL